METNFWEIVLGICGILAVIGGMFRFLWSLLSEKFDSIDQRFEKLESKMDHGFEKIDERFNVLEHKVDVIDKKVGDLNVRVTIVETRLEERQPMSLRSPFTKKRRPGRPPKEIQQK